MIKSVNSFVKISLLFIFLIGLVAGPCVLYTVTVNAETNPESVEGLLNQAPKRSDYPDSDGVVMLDEGLITVDEKGDKEVVITQRIKVFNKEGRQRYGEVTIPYIADSGQPKLNYVRTITPEGEVIEPDKEDIKDITPARLQQYPMYSDVKNKVISMPGLTNGAIIDYSYTLTPKSYFLKDEFSSSWLFRSELPVEVSHFKVTVPREMGVQWTDFESDFPPEVKEDGKNEVFTWKRTDLEKIEEEPAMPPISQISGSVMVTSIDSWEDYAREFWGMAKTQIKPDDAIRKKVEELTKGLEAKEDKVKAVYNYVATKVRYVALEFGRGKYKPHKASEVFHNKYGDCKDKSVLMVSMLKVAGIKAHPVLIQSGVNAKTEFDQYPPGKGLNHAIVAVEMHDGLKFLDPTCDVCPYNYLPDSDRGKKALVIKGDEEKVAQILETESFNPEASEVVLNQTFSLNEDGELATEIQLSYHGFYSYYLKSTLEQYSNQRQKQIFRGLLSQVESGANLDEFEHSDLEDIDKRLDMKLSYTKSGFANKLGDSLIFQTPETLRIPLNMEYGQIFSMPPNERNYPVLTSPAKLVNEVEFTYSEDKELVTPEGVSIDNEWASYRASYETEDGKLAVSRVFTIKKAFTSLEGYGEFRKVVNTMSEDEQANFQLKDS